MPSSAGIIGHVACNIQASSKSKDSVDLHKSSAVESEGRHIAQRTLHLCLKPELSALSDTLRLPVSVLLLPFTYLMIL